MNDLNELARTVRFRRRKLGMTQMELADKSGLTQSQIARFESGKTNVRLCTLLSILKVLDIHITFNVKG